MSIWIYVVLPVRQGRGMPHAFSTLKFAEEYVFSNPDYYITILKIDGERE